MDAGIITHIVTQFHNVFYTGMSTIQSYVLSITLGLIVIDGTFFFIGTFWGGGLMSGWFNKLIRYSVFVLIVSEYPTMIEQILKGFFELGATLGGGGINEEYITNPGSLIDKGWNLCKHTYDGLFRTDATQSQGLTGVIQGVMDALSFKAILNSLILVVLILAIMVCFAIMTVQVALTLIEFYVVGLIIYVLIPFGVFKPTAFMAEKAFGGILTFGVKVCALAIVGSMLDYMFSNVKPLSTMDPMDALYLFLTSLFMAFITWVVPGMAAAACGGSPSLGASGAASAAAGGFSAAMTGAGMLVSGGKIAGRIGQASYNKAKDGYKKIRDYF